MSGAQAVEASLSGTGAVRASIARAAQATGVDFDYLLAQARLESSLDPGARAQTSSAAGLYQFTRGTWLETLDRHGAAHGYGWAGEAIARGRITDPSQAARIWALRMDADASALMAAELARDNRAQLATALGREPDAAELYLGHFLGIGGAGELLTAMRVDPGQSAAALMPRAAAANRAIFYTGNGAARSVSGLMDHIRSKVSAAMERDGGNPLPDVTNGAAWVEATPIAGPAVPSASYGPVARSFAAARAQMAPSAARPSMAQTLQTAFGRLDGEGPAAAPAFVRAAYDKLQRFGM